MNSIISFMASNTGRIARIVVGIALVVWGWVGLGGWGGTVISLVGLVPLVAGLFDVCVLAPLFGAPLAGAKIRAGK